MQTIQSQLEEAFRAAIRSAFDIDADPLVSVSQNEKFGDYQSNAAMGLAKQLTERSGQKTNPRAVAERIKAKLDLGQMVDEVSIAGPGFINVRLSPKWLAGQLERLASDPRLGIVSASPAETVVVDYSGPNIAKQMHVGHLRSTIIGDAISRVLKFRGHHVIRQNHIGDWGTQFGMVILGIWHLIMATCRRNDPTYVRRMGEALADANARKDAAERGGLIQEIHRRHQEDIDADPVGTAIFFPNLAKFVPSLEAVEPAYRFVNAVEEAPESGSLVITRPTSSGPESLKLSRVSNHVIWMLQEQQDQEYRAWEEVRRESLRHAQEIYQRLRVELRPQDVRGESAYRDQLADTVSELQRDSHAGSNARAEEASIRVEQSEGALAVFHRSPAGEPLFRNKEGEPLPFLIRKSDGAFLYATTDLAALRFRVRELHSDRIIYVTDARQSLHFEMLFATARGAGWTSPPDMAHEVRLEHVTFGSMLGEDGKPIKTRSGESVKLADLLDEAVRRASEVVRDKRPDLPPQRAAAIAEAVGIGAVKYADLSKDRVSDYLFSWEKMLSLDGNTAPYLQYAHARIRSIFRKAGGVGGPPLILQSPYELAIAKQILRLGEVLDLVGRELRPHHLCNYLYELSTRFSGFFENCPVIQSAEPTRSSRLLLCELTARTLEIGLDLLGIEHPDEM